MNLQTLLAAWVMCHCSLAVGAPPVSPPVTVDLDKYVRFGASVRLAFSEDGRSICASWPTTPGSDVRKIPVDFVVCDLKGNVLNTSNAATNRNDALLGFPQLQWHEQGQDLITNAVGWSVTADLSQCVRLVNVGESCNVAEMWQLKPIKELLWRTELPTCYGPRMATPVFEAAAKAVVIIKGATEAVVLDRKTGAIDSTFELGHIESDAEAVQRKKKFRLHCDDSDPKLRFRAFLISQCGDIGSSQGYIACGAFFDKRVRVIQLVQPYKVVFEANADVNPCRPRGGVWGVSRVSFLGCGKYLLAEYHFGGSGTKSVLSPAEIFDTATWKVVWHKDDWDIREIMLSPDGKTIAFLRGGKLEIRDFLPDPVRK